MEGASKQQGARSVDHEGPLVVTDAVRMTADCIVRDEISASSRHKKGCATTGNKRKASNTDGAACTEKAGKNAKAACTEKAVKKKDKAACADDEDPDEDEKEEEEPMEDPTEVECQEEGGRGKSGVFFGG